MNNFNLFSYEDIPQNRQRNKETWKNHKSDKHPEWDVINFDKGLNVSDTHSVLVGVGDDDHLVTSLVEALCEVVNVTFYATKVGVKEIRDKAYFHNLWERYDN